MNFETLIISFYLKNSLLVDIFVQDNIHNQAHQKTSFTNEHIFIQK